MEWVALSDRMPPNYSRIIVHRELAGQSYVDCIAYHEEPESGLKPLCDMKHVTHWMEMPAAPNCKPPRHAA